MQEPRQLYGLGSLVKSIGKTIKKVVKSPIGKAAILGIGAFGLPGGALGMKGFLPQAFKTGASQFLFGGGTKFLPGATAAMKGAAVSKPGIFGLAKNFLGSTAGQVGVGAALSALAASGMDQEEIAEIENDPEKLRIYLKDYYSKTNPDASGAEIEEFVRINSATGGRIGFNEGTNMKMASMDENERELMRLVEEFMERGFSQQEAIEEAKDTLERKSIAIGGRVGLNKGGSAFEEYKQDLEDGIISPDTTFNEWLDNNAPDPDYDKSFAIGGRVGLMGGAMPTGIMRANKAGTIERDYRETGGFVPVGIKEKADDVPAMLSKNEFVMTADAVRGIGDGNIEKGAQRLYDQMKTAEKRVV